MPRHKSAPAPTYHTISVTILWPEILLVSCSDFCPNVRAVQMSRSFLVHLSFNFYRSCQPTYHHVLSRSLAGHFQGQNLTRDIAQNFHMRKIIYLKCRERHEDMIDHRSYTLKHKRDDQSCLHLFSSLLIIVNKL